MSETKMTPERIFQFWFGYAPPLMLEAAVRHKVFDALDAGPKPTAKPAAKPDAKVAAKPAARTAVQVAAACGISARGARALLDGLVGLQFLTKSGNAYALTPESAAYLVTTKPTFVGGMFRHTSSQILPNWMKLADAVRTGKPVKAVNQEATGGAFFAEFVEDLFANGIAAARVLADAVGVAKATGPVKVLDIAAGSGVWSIPMAQKSPHVRVTVVDWPAVVPVCKKVTARERVANRYEYRPGDLMVVDYGTGYKVATLGHILHSEGPARSQKLLKRVFDALAPGGVIAIAEMVPNDNRTGPPHALIFALNMLLHTDEGDTFTFAEMSGWLKAAGFRNVRTLEVPSPSPLILADKP